MQDDHRTQSSLQRKAQKGSGSQQALSPNRSDASWNLSALCLARDPLNGALPKALEKKQGVGQVGLKVRKAQRAGTVRAQHIQARYKEMAEEDR